MKNVGGYRGMFPWKNVDIFEGFRSILVQIQLTKSS